MRYFGLAKPVIESRICPTLCFLSSGGGLNVFRCQLIILTSFFKIDRRNVLFDLFLPLVGIDIQGEHIKYPPVTFVGISATRWNIFYEILH